MDCPVHHQSGMSRPPYYSLSRPSSHICLGHLHCSLIQSIITLVCPGSRPPSYSLFKPSFLTYLSRSSPPWSVHHPSNIFWKWARKSWDRRATGVGRRAGEEIVVWNESPEIPDIGETSWYRWRYWPSTHGKLRRGQSDKDEVTDLPLATVSGGVSLIQMTLLTFHSW